ncbi:MAG: hypothetical protein RLO01_09070 [Thalassobaculaceae bacterium]
MSSRWSFPELDGIVIREETGEWSHGSFLYDLEAEEPVREVWHQARPSEHNQNSQDWERWLEYLQSDVDAGPTLVETSKYEAIKNLSEIKGRQTAKKIQGYTEPHGNQKQWDSKYHDIVTRYFWAPSDFDLKSIKLNKEQRIYLTEQGLIPRGQARIYARAGGAIRTTLDRVHTTEEPLNDILNIFLGIAPDNVLSSMFFDPLGFIEDGVIQSVGREIADRFGFGRSNVTQPDGFLLSRSSAVFLEIKTGSNSSPSQLLKYLALAVLEEQVSGRKRQLGLLFITPRSEGAHFWPQLGLHGPEIPDGHISRPGGTELNPHVSSILENSRKHMESVASRIALAHLSWTDLVKQIDAMVAATDQQSPGGQAITRLLSGLRHAIVCHRRTGAGHLGI